MTPLRQRMLDAMSVRGFRPQHPTVLHRCHLRPGQTLPGRPGPVHRPLRSHCEHDGLADPAVAAGHNNCLAVEEHGWCLSSARLEITGRPFVYTPPFCRDANCALCENPEKIFTVGRTPETPSHCPGGADWGHGSRRRLAGTRPSRGGGCRNRTMARLGSLSRRTRLGIRSRGLQC